MEDMVSPECAGVTTDGGDVEERIRQAHKMEVVGQLAAGVAHDFNNLLTVILGSCQFLLEDLGDCDDRIREEVREIQNAGRKASGLTQQLLAFSRKQPLAPEVLHANAVVSDSVELLRRTVGEDVALLTVLHPDCGSCEADPHQLQQVLLNLVVNARDAMPRGGTITIATGRAVFDQHTRRKKPGAVPGDYVTIAVTDTGSGMTKETRARMFEPFFTTKRPGVGTGLGLATVYGIVKQSNGYIDVESELERGSTFTIYFPLVQSREESGPSEAAPVPMGGSETVLLVEDEEPVRVFARKVLERAGYHVLEARDGTEAARLSREYAREIHVVVTDVVMPRRSGRELVQDLFSQGRMCEVLYMSGYTDEAMEVRGVVEGRESFLRKPFTPAAFLAAIRSLLDGWQGAEPRIGPRMAATGG
jgi:nitrogen-specific signal transduction histidine kinase/ActR/RegA family two-component response regulator